MLRSRSGTSSAPASASTSSRLGCDRPFSTKLKWRGDTPARALIQPSYDRLFKTEDYVEGPQAFVEKRAPVWKNR